MRIEMANVADRERLESYSQFLMDLGDGTMETDETGCIQIPKEFLLPSNNPDGALQWVYGDKPDPLPDTAGSVFSKSEYERSLIENSEYYKDKAILCPKNVDVDKLNAEMMKSLPGEEDRYLSADSVDLGDDTGLYVSTEFLNTIDLSGLPPHILSVKVGAVMMLLRNLNPKRGLCNGTRILITSTSQRLLYGVILTEGDHYGEKCAIPRIKLNPSNNPFPFKWGRRQFPLRHAYAMTINKSQGQTITRGALYLPQECFAHGQLYVAFSRSGHYPDDNTRTGMKVVVNDTPIQGRRIQDGGIRDNTTEGVTTPNIVYTEIFK